MPTWSELLALIDHGRAVPLHASLTLWGEPDGSQNGWVTGGRTFTALVLRPGRYHVSRHGRSRLISETDGTPRLVDDGVSLVTMSERKPEVTTGRLVLTTSASVLISSSCLESALQQEYPAGDITLARHDGRACWRVPGLPKSRHGETDASPSILVDAESGVVVKVDNGSGGGELTGLEFPRGFDIGTFSWDARAATRFGTPVPPTPWWPPETGAGSAAAEPVPAPDGQPPVEEFRKTVECFSRTCPAPVPDGHRSLLVVGTVLHRPYIRPGWGRSWIRGVPGEFALGFVEAGDSGSFDEMDYSTIVEPSVVRAWAEPVRDGEPVDQRMNGRGFRWQTVLRGDGWTALWSADRPAKGYVELTGVFYAESSYAQKYSPTRGVVNRIRIDCALHDEESSTPVATERIDVDRSDAFPDWARGQWYGGVDYLFFTIDLDGAGPPPVEQVRQPTEIEEFALSGTGADVVLWRPEAESFPAVWRTDLATGTSRRIMIPVPVDAQWEIQPGPDNTIEVHCRDRILRIDDDRADTDTEKVRPAEPTEMTEFPASSGEVHLVVGDRFFTGSGRVLTLRDRNLQVVRRFRVDGLVERLEVVGPWLGCSTSVIVGAERRRLYRIFDPADMTVAVEIPVQRPMPCLRWFNGEVWIADGRLRAFAPRPDGTWISREVDVPGRRSAP